MFEAILLSLIIGGAVVVMGLRFIGLAKRFRAPASTESPGAGCNCSKASTCGVAQLDKVPTGDFRTTDCPSGKPSNVDLVPKKP